MWCYCGSQRQFTDCCHPLLSGQQSAESCEQLMRSRYSAFCHGDANYLQKSCVPALRNNHSLSALQPFLEQTHFTHLRIIQSSSSDTSAEHGFVEFTVHFIQANQLQSFQEYSVFERLQDQWYYATGEVSDLPSIKIGRNDACPCGSGKKFKACLPHQPSGQAAS